MFGSEFKDANDVSDPVLIAKLFGVEDISGTLDDSWTRVDNTGQSDATSKSPGCTEQCSKTSVVCGTLAVCTEIADCSTVVLSSVDGWKELRGTSTEEPGSTECSQAEGSGVGVYSGGGSFTTHRCSF